ncbi:hypothetical protein F5148DRAFT_63791 [Russula earlei]|uniref:Uncharacterized protein n=1 Tax=Russula earlei TaxID=71964 RepID=A0ACC0U9S2_9AGAM|nr:hypothetical protein F5148DRAFT_63791 [Russula earlei]
MSSLSFGGMCSTCNPWGYFKDLFPPHSVTVDCIPSSGNHSGILSTSHLMPTAPTINPPNFDKLAFRKYMKNIGRAYRKQAVELVSLCRTFVAAQEQSPDSLADVELGMALKVVDDALRSAAEVKNKTSVEVDNKFETAIATLSAYEAVNHPKDPMTSDSHMKTVRERMSEATTKDKSSSGILNTLKEKLKPAPVAWSDPTTVVEFLLFKSLPDDNPTVVKQELGKGSKLTEILWNFARYKDERRLTLSQNPHFYKHLPGSKADYRDNFRTDPTEDFSEPTRIYVLTDRPGRIYLESDQTSRAFGNVWAPSKAIIFKDVCGKLEGESIVHASLQSTSNQWYLDEPPLSPTSPPEAPSPNRSNPSPTMTATSIGSVVDTTFEDWREPIRRRLNSPDTSICIRATPPSASSSSPSSPSSLTPSACSSGSGSDGSPPSKLSMRSTRSTARRTHRSAQPMAVSQRPPTSRLSQRMPTSSRSTTTLQQTPIAALPLAVKATPPPNPTIIIAPPPHNVPQRREPPKDPLRGEAPMPSQIPGEKPFFLKNPTLCPSGFVATPLRVTSLPEPFGFRLGGVDAKRSPNRVDRDVKPTKPPPKTRGVSPNLSHVWQFWIQKDSKLQMQSGITKR